MEEESIYILLLIENKTQHRRKEVESTRKVYSLALLICSNSQPGGHSSTRSSSIAFPNLVLETSSPRVEQTVHIDLALQRLEAVVRPVRLGNVLVAHGVVHEQGQVRVRVQPGQGVPLRDLGLQPRGDLAGDVVDGGVVEAAAPGALELEEQAVRVRPADADGVAAPRLAALPDDRGHRLEVDAALLRQRAQPRHDRRPVVVDLLVDARVVGDVGDRKGLSNDAVLANQV